MKEKAVRCLGSVPSQVGCIQVPGFPEKFMQGDSRSVTREVLANIQPTHYQCDLQVAFQRFGGLLNMDASHVRRFSARARHASSSSAILFPQYWACNFANDSSSQSLSHCSNPSGMDTTEASEEVLVADFADMIAITERGAR